MDRLFMGLCNIIFIIGIFQLGYKKQWKKFDLEKPITIKNYILYSGGSLVSMYIAEILTVELMKHATWEALGDYFLLLVVVITVIVSWELIFLSNIRRWHWLGLSIRQAEALIVAVLAYEVIMVNLSGWPQILPWLWLISIAFNKENYFKFNRKSEHRE